MKHLGSKLFFITAALLTSMSVFAQQGRLVQGSVIDSTKLTIPGSSVKLISEKGDSTYATADVNGKFTFPGVKGTKLTLTISSIGYETLKKHYSLDNDTKPVVLPAIILHSQTHNLATVTIVGQANPVVLKEDTVEYKVSAYKVRENAPVEDVLKKLPGVDVDQNGNVTAQGKQVTKVRVNGKDFFGGDVQTATKNLPADVVESIQVIDDYGDQANLTGVKTGEPNKVLNITIRKDKNYGYFGQSTLGGGNDALPKEPGVVEDGRYVGLLNAFKFKGDQQIAILGNLNNTNVNTFSFNTQGGAGGGGGGGFAGGGGGRGNALRGGAGGGGFTTGATTNANGITNASSIGGNYRDNWGKYLSVYGSYSFSDNKTNTLSSSLQTNNYSLPSTSNQNSNQTDNPINHRFTFNMEFKPDTINYLKLTPTFSYSSTTTNATEGVTSSRENEATQQQETNLAYTSKSYSTSTSPNYGITALYNHRFKGRRNLSININANSSKSSVYDNPTYDYTFGTPTAPLNQQINTDSHNTTFGSNFSYLEPLAKRSYLELNYAYNHSYNTSNKETDTLVKNTLDTYNRFELLSNNYNYTFTTNRVGLNYRFIEKKYNYTLGLGVQPATLDGESIKTNDRTHVNTFNVIPTARFVYNFSRSKALSFNYNGASNQPSFSQLQPVVDFSNALYPVQGNPNLKPEFSNNLSLRYNNFSFQTGNVFFTNFNFTKTDNKIVSDIVTYPVKFSEAALAQDSTLKHLQNTNLTRYLNSDGYYTIGTNLVYAKPWSNRRYTLFFSGNTSFTNSANFSSSVDSNNVQSAVQKNIAKTITLTPGIRFRADFTDIIDAQIGGNFVINRTQNSLSGDIYNQNNNTRTLNLFVNGKNYVWKDWTLSYDFTQSINYGYSPTIHVTNPSLLNAYVERRFMKDHRGTIRFSAFDLFNQNTGFTTVQSGGTVTQSNINRLGRYYLLTFTLRLQKFAGKAPSAPDRGFRNGGDRGGPGGGGPGGAPGGGPGNTPD